MSIFDEVTALFENVFDCAVTITETGQQPRTVRGIFREEPGMQDDLDHAEILVSQPVLKLRAPDVGNLARHDQVQIETRPGVVFTVLSVHPGRSPAVDRHYVAVLSEVVAS